MPVLTKPSEIAREALRLLASRRVEPTPENYRQLYGEIAGPGAGDGAGAEKTLAGIAADFPRVSPDHTRAANALVQAAAQKDWEKFRLVLLGFAKTPGTAAPSAPGWGSLIPELIKQLDGQHGALTRARKKDSLDKLLQRANGDPEKLLPRLQALIKSWAETPGAARSPDDAASTPAAADLSPSPAASAGEEAARQLRELLAQVLEQGLAPQLAHAPELAEQACALAQSARMAEATPAFTQLAGAFRQFVLQIELSGAAGAQVKQGLLRLLKLLIDNICELSADDQWLRGQFAVVHEIISNPLDPDAIEAAEKNLKQVILRQGVLKKSLIDAKTAFKNLVADFIDRLGSFSASTGNYHDKIDSLSSRISATDDVVELGVILEELACETRQVQAATQRSREELDVTRRQVESAEQKIRELESELESVSEKVREDQLTGALNRRGLDDAFDKTIAAAQRKGEPLSLALLDIDNFKHLNDDHGHQAGDDALVHLVQVINDTVRPTDVVARYGGEEFVILLPDSTMNDAIAVMTRVQRALTKQFFLHDNKRLLITFSAGVALRAEQEPREALIARADKALYQAKRTGKNRVVAA